MPLPNGTNISPYNNPNFNLLITRNLAAVAAGGVAVHNTITETGFFVGRRRIRNSGAAEPAGFYVSLLWLWPMEYLQLPFTNRSISKRVARS